jgi:biofilm PGA synthesis protein PgaA
MKKSVLSWPDKALARYDRVLLTAWKDEPSAQNDVRRAELTAWAPCWSVNALLVISEYESLSASGEVPNYANAG